MKDQPIVYHWHDKAPGYSRLIPHEERSRAMRSVSSARARGVKFDIDKTFAGTRITVVSIPPKINKKFLY